MSSILSYLVEVNYMDPRNRSTGGYDTFHVDYLDVDDEREAALVIIEHCKRLDPDLEFMIDKITEWTEDDERREASLNDADSRNDWDLR